MRVLPCPGRSKKCAGRPRPCGTLPTDGKEGGGHRRRRRRRANKKRENYASAGTLAAASKSDPPSRTHIPSSLSCNLFDKRALIFENGTQGEVKRPLLLKYIFWFSAPGPPKTRVISRRARPNNGAYGEPNALRHTWKRARDATCALPCTSYPRRSPGGRGGSPPCFGSLDAPVVASLSASLLW